jgi:hypothetical protein
MEDLTIFRIFLTFPFIGLLIPDMGIAFSNSINNIPVSHTIIEATLLLSIIVCSMGMAYFKRKGNAVNEAVSA